MSPNILTPAADAKKAVLVVGFGTLYQDSVKKNITAVTKKIKDAFPGCETRQAFTSRIIAARELPGSGKTETEKEALTRLKNEGYTSVIVQSLHITAGQEFEKLKETVKYFAAGGAFAKIVLGRPLLYYLGQEKKPDDYQAAIEAIAKELPSLGRDEAFVMQGHDGTHPANSAYAALQLKFIDAGYKNVHIFTLKGYPKLTSVIEKLKTDSVKRVTLAPLMLAAGGHARKDMAGDRPDSARNLLLAAGFEVEARLRGLGENSYIQDIFVRHAEDAAAELSVPTSGCCLGDI